MKDNIITLKFLCAVLACVVFCSGYQTIAQNAYTYTPEGFEEDVWGAAPNSSNTINASTGTWLTAANNVRSTAIPPQSGIYSLYLASKSNSLISPVLLNGAGVVTVYFCKPSGGGRTMMISTSTDRVTWSSPIDSVAVPATWTIRRVLINNPAVRYIRFTLNSNGGVYLDSLLISSGGAANVTVTTAAVNNIMQRTATGGGAVETIDSSLILSRGVCWSTSPLPDTSASRVQAAGRTGTFTCLMQNLMPGTSYNARAYAVTQSGVNYGQEVSFMTLPPDAPLHYWTQGFNDPTQMPSSSPASPLSINIPSQGEWIFLKAYRGTNPAYIRDSSASCLRMLKNGSYVVTPILTDGVSSLLYDEGRGGREITIYTSADGGANWNLLMVDTTALRNKNVVQMNSSLVNRIKIANESGGDADVDNITISVYPSGTPPVLTTAAVTGIGKNNAETGGSIVSEGSKPVIERGVCWKAAGTPLIADNKVLSSGTGSTYTCSLINLPAGSSIHVRAFATSRAGTAYGDEIVFSTLPATKPLVLTMPATTITSETALAGGNITDGGGAPISQRGVCWNTTGTPQITDSKTMDSVGIGTYQSLMVQLTPTTKYYFRAYAVNSAGVSYGAVDSVTTGQIHFPAVTTSAVSSVHSYKAVCGGTVTDDGNAPTVRGICWNRTGNPTTADSKSISGSGAGTFSSKMGYLSGSCTYYLRAFVTNSLGTAYGNEVVFTTAAAASYYVSPTGDDISGNGSLLNPYYSVHLVVDRVNPGDTIYLRGGIFNYTRRIKIGKKGDTDGGMIVMKSYPGERAVLDFSSMALADSNQGIRVTGSYWHFFGLDIKGAGDNGMLIERNKPSGGTYAQIRDSIDQAHDNVVENCSFRENRDTGLQLKNLAENNKIINCDSYYNRDPDEGDADGFAPKLTVGTGNYFYGCRAWQNSDDGWDGLLTATENGFPDDVTTTIENCWAFMNGYRINGTATSGNGNGFKLGGAVDRHNMILRRCVAFDNLQKGFDQNHNTGDMTLINCSGFAFPLPGNSSHYTYRIDGTILAEGKKLVHINNIAVSDGLASNSAYAPCQMIGGIKTTCNYLTMPVDFVTIDTAGVRGPRKPDGSLPDVGFMHIKAGNVRLINTGTIVPGITYFGTAPDLGAFEYDANTGVGGDSHFDLKAYEFALAQNYPNPFNPSTTFEFTLAEDGHTTLMIFDILGRRVEVLAEGFMKAGALHSAHFNATKLSSGIYFARLESGSSRQIRKIVLMK